MRSVPEWIGKTDDSRPPLTVCDRVAMRYRNVCQICFTRIASGMEIDHRVAIANGGENREHNLQPVHAKCHRGKTQKDRHTLARTRRTRAHHLGIQKPRIPMPGSRASGLKKRMDGTVERRRNKAAATTRNETSSGEQGGTAA